MLTDIATRAEDVDHEALAGEYLTPAQVAQCLAAPTPPDADQSGGQASLDPLGVKGPLTPVELLAAAAAWYLVPCLAALRAECDAAWPHRDRASDGSIGDAAHQQGQSDHNPDALGRVLALDLDRDGVPMDAIVAAVIGAARLQYVIFRRVIWSRSWGWRPRAYTGPNPHDRHAHFSGRHDHFGESDRSTWLPASLTGRPPSPRPKPPPPPPPRPPRNAPGTRIVRQGMVGPDVEYVQRFIGRRRAGAPDGKFGPVTASGVRWYQRMRGITVDGAIGPVTWRHMGIRWRG